MTRDEALALQPGDLVFVSPRGPGSKKIPATVERVADLSSGTRALVYTKSTGGKSYTTWEDETYHA